MWVSMGGGGTYRAAHPRLEGVVVARLDGPDYGCVSIGLHPVYSQLTRDILVPAERARDDRSVREGDVVLGRGRVKTLDECERAVGRRTALAADGRTDKDLIRVDKLGRDPGDVRRRGRGEVDGAQVRAKLERLGLHGCEHR
jgi:hypothetical protein